MIVSTLIAALATGFLAPEGDTKPWIPFTSRDGNFIVDLPGKPTKVYTRTARSKEGQVKIIVAQCDTPDILYTAQKIDLPKATGMKNDEIEAVLDFWRDDLANSFNGKVTAQKKLRLAGSTGRDITIEGRPLAKGGLATIRVREYLGQKALYILVASTAPDRELPEDVGHFFASFTIGTTRTNKMGPHPEPTGKPLANWGEVIDPDNDCKISAQARALEIQVPGTHHDLNADIDKFNAPRVVREVSGDFTVTTKIVGTLQPGSKSTNPKSVPCCGAGVFVWQDSDNYIFLGRMAILKNKKVGEFAAFEEREWGARAAINNHKIDAGDAYVKLERRGNRLLGYTSKDGKAWEKLEPMETSYPSTLKVGVYALNSSNAPLTIRFENFNFTEGKSNGATRKR